MVNFTIKYVSAGVLRPERAHMKFTVAALQRLAAARKLQTIHPAPMMISASTSTQFTIFESKPAIVADVAVTAITIWVF